MKPVTGIMYPLFKVTMKIISLIHVRQEFLGLWSGMSLNYYYIIVKLIFTSFDNNQALGSNFYYLVLMLPWNFGLEADWKWTGSGLAVDITLGGIGLDWLFCLYLIVQKCSPSSIFELSDNQRSQSSPIPPKVMSTSSPFPVHFQSASRPKFQGSIRTRQ